MKINILASGSAGNCIAITHNGKTILIDIGIAKTKVEKSLGAVGIYPGDVVGVLITHAHGDHVKGLPFAGKYNIPVFATPGEWKKISNVDNYDVFPSSDKHSFNLNSFKVSAFGVHHDSREPVGYAVTTPSGKVSVCLDTGHVDNNMLQAMAGSDHYIIEANHEPAMVGNSSYPRSVQARVLSDIGHLSNEQTAQALSTLVQGKGESIYLVHLSNSNNTPGIARMETIRVLMEKGYKPGKDYYLEVIS